MLDIAIETPKKLTQKTHVAAYLEKEGIEGVKLDDFDFKIKRKVGPTVDAVAPKKQLRNSDVFAWDNEESVVDGEGGVEEEGGLKVSVRYRS